MAIRTGYKITIYLDDNPLSPTYMQTYEEKTLDEDTCPIPTDDLVLVSNECEIDLSGYTGYRLEIYYNRTTGEYVEQKVEDPECIESSTDEQWINSGSPYCEVTDKGINTGYMLQPQVQMNPNLANYGETRTQRYKSPDCGSNTCALWDDIQKQCHVAVVDCVATFDGTADISQIDINPLSPTYNQTRTINKQDSDCKNCTNTFFSWIDVGTMCGDDELLCSNGIQQVSTNSYIVSQKYKTISETIPPIPMDEYQIHLKIEDDEDCGYIRPLYSLQKLEGQYLCDYETYTKYEMYVRTVSYDGGVTWSVWTDKETGEIHTERGEVIAYDSYDCGKPMYRWVDNGEIVCEDNGDDGKLLVWNSDGTLSTMVTCNESGVLTKDEIDGRTAPSTALTSDTYTSTWQVGDCTNELDTNAFQYNGFGDNKLWIGNYTAILGSNSLLSYNRKSLDIPNNVTDMHHQPFGSRSKIGEYFRTLVMHPTTPPIMDNEDLPANLCADASTSGANSFNSAAIFVPADSYELYCEALPVHRNSYRGRILPMNQDTIQFKAIIGYESDFSKWDYYVPDGEDNTTLLREEAYWGGNIITSITITDKVLEIADNAFYKYDNYFGMYNIKSINLGETVEHIGSYAFKAGSSSVLQGGVTSLVIPRSVRSIGSYAFENYPLSSLTIENGVETIAYNAFANNRLTTLTLPDSVKTIGENAFKPNSYVAQLTEITIGSGVEEIGQSAFYQNRTNNVQPLQRVYVRALVPPTIPDTNYGHIFGATRSYGSWPTKYEPYGSFTVYVPYESYNDYMSSKWQFFDNGSCSVVPYNTTREKIATLYLDDGTTVEVETLAKQTLSDYANVTTAITVNSNCKTIIDDAFVDFAKLDRITMESSVPVPIGNLQTKYFDVPKIYVPSNAYATYLSEWSEYEGKIIPIGAQEEYVKKYTILDLYDSKKKDKYQLIITYNRQRIEKDVYRLDVVENDCYSVSYNTYGVVGGLGSELNTYEHVWNQIKGTSLVSQMVYISNLEVLNLGGFTVRMTFSNIPSSTLTLPFRVQLHNSYDNSGNPNGTIYFYSGNTEVTELRKSQAYQHPVDGDGSDRRYNVNIPTSDGVCGVYFNFNPNDKRSSYGNGHTRWVTLSLDREIILARYN